MKDLVVFVDIKDIIGGCVIVAVVIIAIVVSVLSKWEGGRKK